MNGEKRAELARRALAGYVSGPGAPAKATELALRKVETARAVIVVEGISDQIAVETLAIRRGRDLDAEGVAVLPVGGAQAVTRYLERFGPAGEDLRLAGLCDSDGVETFRRALTRAGVGKPISIGDMAGLGFHVCVRDLEDELIRAVGSEGIESVIDSQGDLGSFRALQNQPEWRGRPVADQLHRFFRSHSRRNLRYARLLIQTLEPAKVPSPLDAVLAAA